jgi:1-phosphofructokinase family hexose kinase
VIVTLTPNPSVDRTVRLEELVPGAVNRTDRARVEASGKGVNVTRVVRAHYGSSIAVLPAGGTEGEQLLALLAADQVPVRAVPISGAVRVNVSVVTPDGLTTKLNEPGPLLSASDVEALLAATAEVVAETEGRWLVISGTLPPGVHPELVARAVKAGHTAGARVAVDASGPALVAAAGAGADLLAPNLAELAETAGGPLATLVEVAAAARDLGPDASWLVSLGRDGAVLVRPDRCLRAEPPEIEVVNTVGAGDALLAGWVAADTADTAARLARAVAWGSSACLAVGTAELPEHPVTAGAVTIRELDLYPRRPAGTAS